MRLREADKRPVTVKRPGAELDDLYTWGAGKEIRAVIQPLTGTAAAQIYGETRSQARLMLYDGPEKLEAGMGVCVDVDGGASCDYRIAEPPQVWSHQRAVLEWIKEGRRG